MSGGSHFGEDTLAFSSEHLCFIPRSFSSGKRSLSCFLVFWKVALGKAGSKEVEHDLLTRGKSCTSGSSLLRAGPPGPVVLGMLQGGPEATHDRLPWPGTTGSAPALQTSGRKLVVLEALGKQRTSCQL